MRALFTVLVLMCAATSGELKHKWNPNYACTGTDTFTVRVTSTAGHDTTMRVTGVIGAYPVVKFDFAQVAREKIPEVCERIGPVAAAEQGYYPVRDTVEVDAEKAIELQRRWTTDVKAKPVRVKYVDPMAAELEPIEVIR